MRKVQRLPKPDSLKENAERWTKELIDEIQKQGSYSKVPDSFKNKYRQQDVQETLEKMYKNHCCYCESIVGTSSYGRIEHLKPKSLPQFYQKTFEWENLHWCCEICNTSYKMTKWDFEYPILDPSEDEIDKYLKLNLITGEYEAIDNSRRAETTIKDTGMNRDRLVKARKKIIILFLKEYKMHQKSGDEKEFCHDWMILKEDMDYPSVYEKLIDSLHINI